MAVGGRKEQRDVSYLEVPSVAFQGILEQKPRNLCYEKRLKNSLISKKKGRSSSAFRYFFRELSIRRNKFMNYTVKLG